MSDQVLHQRRFRDLVASVDGSRSGIKVRPVDDDTRREHAEGWTTSGASAGRAPTMSSDDADRAASAAEGEAGSIAGAPRGRARTIRGLLGTWLQAVRAPRLALVSAVGSAYAVAEMTLVIGGAVERTSAIAAFLLVFASPTLIATLPDTTVLWRVGALGIGLHVGPLVYAPMERWSFAAFLDSWAAAIGDDGGGVLLMFVCAAIALPVLEGSGAVIRRRALAAEAAVRRG